ncbi:MULTISPECIES: branched-chain amino acid ABC transporter permease [Bradyrhizobium]|uniref:Branched-chain amino acid ABC transporter permease n=1 Tax=Bradyrhizobium elkanii TaxID=29448 RepID=A0A4V6CYT8_BRAEL|nr:MULTISPECIES: branched-chain amino acid ABC transporter permease [Bradyrhizobium]MTV14053.1 branched-chain amino acid ABC transporter permease [Bradyrhizobium sp. BR2003]TKV80365.1 branched-chain amino acid ABC transporter permease [Bradyrhizobium elkanii]
MSDEVTIVQTTAPDRISPAAQVRRATLVLAASAVLGALALPWLSTSYATTLAIEIMVAGVFASGINLLVGTTGLVSLGQGMFLGLGGYGIGLGTTVLGLPLWLSVPATLVLVALLAAGIGAVCTRTRGVEFLLITLAFSQMIYGAAIKLRLTNGSDGMSGIPRPDLGFLGLNADSPVVFYYYILVVTVLAVAAVWRVVESPFGSVLAAIRESERRAVAMGYTVSSYKIGAFVVAAVTCAVAGILQSQYTYFINPDSMSWQLSGEGVLMVIIGSTTTVAGPLVGAAVFVLAKQGLSVLTTEYMLFFGIFFMLVVAFFRNGVVEALKSAFRSRP